MSFEAEIWRYVAVFMAGLLIWLAKGAYGFYYDRKKFQLLRVVFPIREVNWWDHLFEYARGRPRAQLQVRCSLIKKVDGHNPSTYRAYVHVAEVDELVRMVKELVKWGIEVDYKIDCSIDTEVGAVLIGSDSNLQMSGSILDNLGPSVEWVKGEGKHAIVKWKRGEESPLSCSHDAFAYVDEKTDDKKLIETERVSKDYGLIVRKEMDDGVDVLLCAGIHMHGTAAALRTVLQKGFQQEVSKAKYSHFVKVVKASVDVNGLSLAIDPVERTKYPLQELVREKSRTVTR